MLIDKAGAKHIYILTLYNIANIPTTYHESSNYIIRSIQRKILTLTVNSYNKQLPKIFNAKEYDDVVTLITYSFKLK